MHAHAVFSPPVPDMASTPSWPSNVLNAVFDAYLEDSRPRPAWDEEHIQTNPAIDLLALARVCRRWRDVIFNTPSYWQEVYVGRSIPGLEHCLARSEDLPIHVSIAVDDATILRHVANVLSFHAMRIEELKLFNVTPASLSALRQNLFRIPMTELFHFSVCGSNPSTPTTRLDDSSISFLPPFETLSLRHTLMDWRSTVLGAQLREFKYFVPPFMDPQLMSFDTFLGFLKPCVALEELWLHGGCPFFPFNSPGEDITRGNTEVVLSEIQSLRIELWPKTACFALLAHLRLPVTADVSVLALTNTPGADRILHIAPIDPRSLPMLAAATSVGLSDRRIFCSRADGLRGSIEISCFTDRPDPAFPPAPGAVRWWQRMPRTFFQNWLADSISLLGRAPVRSLTVDVHQELTSDMWGFLFNTFLGVSSLRVSGSRAVGFNGLFEALQTPASRLPAPPFHFVAPQNGPSLSHLHALALDVEWRASFVPKVGLCLSWRAEQGLRLEVLSIRLRGRAYSPRAAALPDPLRDRALASIRASLVTVSTFYQED